MIPTDLLLRVLVIAFVFTEPVQLALIAAGLAVCNVITGAIVAIKTFRRIAALEANALETTTNSKMEELLKKTAEEAYARGAKDEKERPAPAPPR